jgi:hypothetical protein
MPNTQDVILYAAPRIIRAAGAVFMVRVNKLRKQWKKDAQQPKR